MDFHPLPRHLASAEVHIPQPSSLLEVVSTSVRVSGDDFETPKSSLVDPSPLAVATDTPSPASPAHPSSDVRSSYPAHNSAIHVSSLLPHSLQLPQGPRRYIVLSSGASSEASSCDGNESELTSEDSDIPRPRFLAPSMARKQRRSGSCEFLGPTPQGMSRSRSVSPVGSPIDSYSEDDTVLVTRRRVEVESQQHRSFFTPSPTMEIVEFATPLSAPPSNLGQSASLKFSRERIPSPYPMVTNTSQLPLAMISRTVPLSAITHTQ